MSETSVKALQCILATSGLLRIDHIGYGVGVIFYDPGHKVGVGLHILAARATNIKNQNPIMYANTAIPQALKLLETKNVKPPFSVAIAGGATMLGMQDSANMSGKIIAAVKEAMASAHLDIKIEKTGGNSIRSMVLDIDNGKIKVT